LNVQKSKDLLREDVHTQELKDIVDSTRSIFDTQFENYLDTTYTTSSPQVILDGQTVTFTINASGGSTIDIPAGAFPVWDPLTSILQDLVHNGLYTIILTANVAPSNNAGETQFDLVETDNLVSRFLLAGPTLENVDTGIFTQLQSVFVLIGGTFNEDFSFHFTVSSNQMDSSIADRRLTILRSM
jgi:hypothetical protein